MSWLCRLTAEETVVPARPVLAVSAEGGGARPATAVPVPLLSPVRRHRGSFQGGSGDRQGRGVSGGEVLVTVVMETRSCQSLT